MVRSCAARAATARSCAADARGRPCAARGAGAAGAGGAGASTRTWIAPIEISTVSLARRRATRPGCSRRVDDARRRMRHSPARCAVVAVRHRRPAAVRDVRPRRVPIATTGSSVGDAAAHARSAAARSRRRLGRLGRRRHRDDAMLAARHARGPRRVRIAATHLQRGRDAIGVIAAPAAIARCATAAARPRSLAGGCAAVATRAAARPRRGCRRGRRLRRRCSGSGGASRRSAAPRDARRRARTRDGSRSTSIRRVAAGVRRMRRDRRVAPIASPLDRISAPK